MDSFSKCFLLSLGSCQMEAGNPSWHGGASSYQTGFTIFCELKDLDESPFIVLKIKMSTRTFHQIASPLLGYARVCGSRAPTEDKAPLLRTSLVQVGKWPHPLPSPFAQQAATEDQLLPPLCLCCSPCLAGLPPHPPPESIIIKAHLKSCL